MVVFVFLHSIIFDDLLCFQGKSTSVQSAIYFLISLIINFYFNFDCFLNVKLLASPVDAAIIEKQLKLWLAYKYAIYWITYPEQVLQCTVLKPTAFCSQILTVVVICSCMQFNLYQSVNPYTWRKPFLAITFKRTWYGLNIIHVLQTIVCKHIIITPVYHNVRDWIKNSIYNVSLILRFCYRAFRNRLYSR